MARFRSKYIYNNNYGRPQHIWTVIHGQGAIHLHINDMGQEYADKYRIDRYSGGLEIHYRKPPLYMKNDAPSQDECWILKCPCWHNGSSLEASEIWIPQWLNDQHDHDRMLASLEQYATDQFEGEDD